MPSASPWPGPPRHVDARLRQYFAEASVVLGNLETPLVAVKTCWHAASGAIFHNLADEELDAWLAALDIAPHKLLLSLANNHIYDQGLNGLQHTEQALASRGIGVLGADGATAAITDLSVYGLPQVGVLAWTHWLNNDPERRKGTHLPHITRYTDMVRAGQCHDRFAGLVLGMPHWGYEFLAYPNITCQQQAERCVQLGVDVLLGSHSHTPQPLAWVGPRKDKLCAFSLGDFNGFPAPAWAQVHHVRVGQLLVLRVAAGQLVSYETVWVEWDAQTCSMLLHDHDPLGWR